MAVEIALLVTTQESCLKQNPSIVALKTFQLETNCTKISERPAKGLFIIQMKLSSHSH
jgi:hypothetical protein